MKLKNPQQSRGKNKNKNKYKKASSDSRDQKFQDPTTRGIKRKCKVKYPCMVFVEDHVIKDCSHLAQVQQYVKGDASQLVVLTNPFLPQQQQMVATNHVTLQRGNIGHPQHGVEHLREIFWSNDWCCYMSKKLWSSLGDSSSARDSNHFPIQWSYNHR